MASMAATTKLALHFPENLHIKKMNKNVGFSKKKILKVEEKENTSGRRNLSVAANSGGYQAAAAADMINGKKLNGIHVGKEMMSSSWDACMLGKFVEERFVYRQTFVIRSYEIGPDKTATMETLMNLLQVCGQLMIVFKLFAFGNSIKFMEMFLIFTSGNSSESCFRIWVGRGWIRGDPGDESQETDMGGDPYTHSSRKI